MGAAASIGAMPKSEEEALAKGFAQEEIDEYKADLCRCSGGGHTAVKKGASISKPSSLAIATNATIRPRPPERPRPVVNTFTSAGMAALESSVRRASRPLPAQVYGNRVIVPVARRPTQHMNVDAGQIPLPRRVYPASTLAASVTSAPSGQRPAASLLGNWLMLARRKLDKRKTTQQTLQLSWFRFDEHAIAAADVNLSASESLSSECCICLENLAHGEKASVLPCGHRFHFLCIRDWVVHTPLCPLCKKSARSASGPRPPHQSNRATYKKSVS